MTRLPCGGTPYEDVSQLLLAHVGYVSQDLIEAFADLFATNNPSFNREKFVKSCGIPDSS